MTATKTTAKTTKSVDRFTSMLEEVAKNFGGKAAEAVIIIVPKDDAEKEKGAWIASSISSPLKISELLDGTTKGFKRMVVTKLLEGALSGLAKGEPAPGK